MLGFIASIDWQLAAMCFLPMFFLCRPCCGCIECLGNAPTQIKITITGIANNTCSHCTEYNAVYYLNYGAATYCQGFCNYAVQFTPDNGCPCFNSGIHNETVNELVMWYQGITVWRPAITSNADSEEVCRFCWFTADTHGSGGVPCGEWDITWTYTDLGSPAPNSCDLTGITLHLEQA
jgi:hypothetical protein